MTDAVIFRLFGPLSSWGTEQVGDVQRDTDTHPTKSGVCGLAAACLGIDRADTASLRRLATMRFACLVLAPGHLVEDFHTVSSGALPARCDAPTTRKEELEAMRPNAVTAISRRYYLADAMSLVALQGEMAREVAAALVAPHYQPFLGRKCCPPALPFEPCIVPAAEDLTAALIARASIAAGDRSLRTLRVGRSLSVYFEDGMLSLPADARRLRRDHPVDFGRATGRATERWELHSRVDISQGVSS